MGQSNSKNTETINWKGLNTNDMSSTIPNINGISLEAKELISRLNIPDISENQSEFNIDHVFHNSNSNSNKKNEDFDDQSTSPFISSEMYEYLINKHKNTKNTTNMIGGAKDDDDDELTTSDTTDDVESNKKDKNKLSKKKVSKESDEDDEYTEEKEVLKGKRKMNKKKKNKESESYLTYVSSSAHTGGSLTESIQNENSYSISSVNTSDINMISDN
jgi:hypothetical protein